MPIPTMEVDPVQHDTDTAYRALVLAVIHRAVLDSQGMTRFPGPGVSPAQLQAEAAAWLASGAAGALLELCGFDDIDATAFERLFHGTTHPDLLVGRDL